MKDFVILTDSACDLDKKYRDEYQIEYVPMHFIIDGKDYEADTDWKDIGVKEFYDHMRNGTVITTAQVTAVSYRDAFNKAIDEGKDVLLLATSSGLSASINTAIKVKEEMAKTNPETKIIIVDTLKACLGLGLLCIMASEQKKQGKTIDEVAEWVETNKLRIHQEGTAEKLTYLRRAGRLSATSAFFGGLLNIKPIVVFDAQGKNCGLEKVKGRQASLKRLVERFIENTDVFPDRIFIAHADCEEDARFLFNEIKSHDVCKDLKIDIGYVGSAVGASCGPGMISLYFYGKEITLNK